MRTSHFVYIAPTDRPPTDAAITGITKLAQHSQCWLRWQMGAYKTITLHNPVVETFRSRHPAIWFSTNDPSGMGAGRWPTKYPLPYDVATKARRTTGDSDGWFWQNTIDDLEELAHGGFGQEFDTWVVYIDAPLAHGQYVGGACIGYSGVCVLPEQDVRAVQGIDPFYTYCREIGGCTHELLHTFGIPHPDGDPNYNHAVMGTGYSIYPNCILTQSEKDQLSSNPFFAMLSRTPQPHDLCHFNDGLVQPRPKPVVHPRPKQKRELATPQHTLD